MGPTAVEERFDSLEARVTALEHLVARIDDWRRETRVLNEDVIGRIQLLGEGIAAQIATLSDKVSAQERKLDSFATRAEMRSMFDEVNARLRALESKRRGDS